MRFFFLLCLGFDPHRRIPLKGRREWGGVGGGKHVGWTTEGWHGLMVSSTELEPFFSRLEEYWEKPDTRVPALTTQLCFFVCLFLKQSLPWTVDTASVDGVRGRRRV